ncbi:unnamed protein product [Prunus armeniaca]
MDERSELYFYQAHVDERSELYFYQAHIDERSKLIFGQDHMDERSGLYFYQALMDESSELNLFRACPQVGKEPTLVHQAHDQVDKEPPSASTCQAHGQVGEEPTLPCQDHDQVGKEPTSTSACRDHGQVGREPTSPCQAHGQVEKAPTSTHQAHCQVGKRPHRRAKLLVGLVKNQPRCAGLGLGWQGFNLNSSSSSIPVPISTSPTIGSPVSEEGAPSSTSSLRSCSPRARAPSKMLYHLTSKLGHLFLDDTKIFSMLLGHALQVGLNIIDFLLLEVNLLAVANLAAWCFGPRGCASTRDVLLLSALRLCAGVPARSTVRQYGAERGTDLGRQVHGLSYKAVLVVVLVAGGAPARCSESDGRMIYGVNEMITEMVIRRLENQGSRSPGGTIEVEKTCMVEPDWGKWVVKLAFGIVKHGGVTPINPGKSRPPP